MSRTNLFVTITAVLILAIMAVGFQRGPALAQTGSTEVEDFDVPFQLTGTIKPGSYQPLNSSVSLIILVVEGEEITVKINPATELGDGALLDDGTTIYTFVVVMDDDGYVAKVITEGDDDEGQATGTAPVPVASATGTATSTAVATTISTTVATTVATTAAGCGSPNPVAIRLAAAFGVSPEEIMAKHCAGFGFGEIAKAYQLARLCAESDNPAGCKSADDFLDMKKGGKGWGNIIKESGVDPRKLAPGQIMKGTADGSKPGKGKGGPKASADAKDKGNGNGKGNGKGNGNGNGGK
jgi:hypothetical protein